MVEPDAPVLSRGRIAAFVVLLAAVVTWDAGEQEDERRDAEARSPVAAQ